MPYHPLLMFYEVGWKAQTAEHSGDALYPQSGGPQHARVQSRAVTSSGWASVPALTDRLASQRLGLLEAGKPCVRSRISSPHGSPVSVHHNRLCLRSSQALLPASDTGHPLCVSVSKPPFSSNHQVSGCRPPTTAWTSQPCFPNHSRPQYWKA